MGDMTRMARAIHAGWISGVLLGTAVAALAGSARAGAGVPARAIGATRTQAVDTIYVDNRNPVCREDATGSAADPFCRITDALTAHHAPGTIILVKPGTYREQVTLPASGLPDQLLTLKAASEPGDLVVIDGADEFGQPGLWAPAGTDIWRAASVTWIPQQVRAQGMRLAPWSGAVDQMPLDSWSYVLGAGLYVRLDADPATLQVMVGRRRYGIYLPNRSYVRIEGFTVLEPDDRGIQLNTGSNHDEIVGNVVRWANHIGIQAIGTSNTRIAGNTVLECNDHGISLTAGSTGCTIEDNESAFNADPARRRANGIYLFGCPGNLIQRNRWHHNQDTGQQVQSGSNDVVSIQNLSWANGDHGFDHLHATGSVNVGDVAYGNFKDGFSFEGNANGSQIFNSIGVENGLTTEEADLWVDDSSSVNFASNDNIFWNSTSQPPIKRGFALFSDVSSWSSSTGHDTRSFQSNPLFVDPAAGDFHLRAGSPAIDNANSDAPFWPKDDAEGRERADDLEVPDAGLGPVTFADRGALEFIPTTSTTAAAGDPRRTHGMLRIQPNPMRSGAEVLLTTARAGAIDLAVYDLGGRRVRTLRPGSAAVAGGEQRVALDPRTDDGRPLQPGVYFVRVHGPDGPLTQRFLILR